MENDTNTLKSNNVEIYTKRKKIFGAFFALRMCEHLQKRDFILINWLLTTNKF